MNLVGLLFPIFLTFIEAIEPNFEDIYDAKEEPNERVIMIEQNR